MEKLLNKYKEIKKTRKGFTLVELLVVIAILAVLASVSVVGYLGFTSKAKNSAALTELSQAKEVIRIELLSGSKSFNITSGSDNGIEVATSSDTLNNGGTIEIKDGNENTSKTYTIEFNYKNESGSYSLEYNVKDSNGEAKGIKITWTTLLKKCFTDLNTLNGNFEVAESNKSISSVKYTTNDGNGTAYWTISTDKVGNDSVSGTFNATTTISNS